MFIEVLLLFFLRKKYKKETKSASNHNHRYTAPEIIELYADDDDDYDDEKENENEKESRYTNKIDIWSMGITLYRMLSKEFPFQFDDEILSGAFTFSAIEWRFVSDDMKDFIRKVLVRNPSQRPTATRLLCEDWLSAVDPEVQKAIEVMQLEQDKQQQQQQN